MSNYKLKAKNKATGEIIEFNIEKDCYRSMQNGWASIATLTKQEFNQLFEVISDTCDDWIEEFNKRYYKSVFDAYGDYKESHKILLDDIKQFIITVLEKQKQDIIKIIEDEPTEFPVRESDEFDAGGRAFKQALLSKIK